MIIYVDIDGTICTQAPRIDGQHDYSKAEPFTERIEYINTLYEAGHTIHYWTARGVSSGRDYFMFTDKQLKEWGCKFHRLHVGTKPHFDIYVCDKSFNSDAWFQHQKLHKELLK